MVSVCAVPNAPPLSPLGLKYYPQTKEELFAFARDGRIYLGDIDTSKITDMSFLFANTGLGRSFLEYGKYPPQENFIGIELWDVSNVMDMSAMFFGSGFPNRSLNSQDGKKSRDCKIDSMLKDSPLESNPPQWYEE